MAVLPALLVLNERSGGAQPAILRYVGVVNSGVLSAAFGTAVATTGSTQHNQKNRAWVFDATTLYAVVQDGLYKSTDSGATFAVDKAFTAPAVVSDDARLTRAGCYFAYDGVAKTPYLTGVFLNSAGNLVGWRLNLNTDAFDETVGPAAAAILGDEYLFNNAVHFLTDGPLAVLRSWNPIAQTFSLYADPTAPPTLSAGLAVLADGSLYAVYNNDSAVEVRMAKFTGTWNDVGGNIYDTLGAVIDASKNEQRFGLFEDPASGDAIMLHLVENGGTVGWAVKQIPSPFTALGVAIQATVLAGFPALLSNADGGTATNVGTKRVAIVQDTQTTPGSTAVYLMFADNNAPGTPWTVYQWNGVGAPITLLGVGGDVANGVPVPVVSGGSRFYSPGQLMARWAGPARQSSPGGQELSVILSGGGSRIFRFRFAKTGRSAGSAKAKLIAPVTGGGTLGADEVTGAIADGSTVHTVVWDLENETPAFASGEANSILVPEISA